MTNNNYVNDIQAFCDNRENLEAYCEPIADIIIRDFDGWEAMKSLFALISRCKSKEEFEIVDNTIIAITGWSMRSLIDRVTE